MECLIVAVEGASTREYTLANFISQRDRGRLGTATIMKLSESPPANPSQIRCLSRFLQSTTRWTHGDGGKWPESYNCKITTFAAYHHGPYAFTLKADNTHTFSILTKCLF